jgi:hypothetical protein
MLSGDGRKGKCLRRVGDEHKHEYSTLPIGSPVRVRGETSDFLAPSSRIELEVSKCKGSIRIDDVSRDWAFKLDEKLQGLLAPATPASNAAWMAYCKASSTWTARMIDYGTYSPTKSEKRGDGLTVVTGTKLVAKESTIEASVGTNFGFRYTLDGPDDTVLTVVRVRHPPLTDPASRKRATIDEWTQEMQPRRLGWSTGWIVDHDWEIADGEWTIQLLVNERLLLEKTFLVRRRVP